MSCATAYFLAREGVKPLIVERESVGCGASGAAAGLLSPLAEARGSGPVTDLGLASLRLHRELAQTLPQESGIDYYFVDTPIFRPAFDEKEEASLRDSLAWQQRRGMDVEWLTPDDLRRLDDAIVPDARGGILSRVEAQVEPYRFVLALTTAVERMGGSVRHATVAGLTSEGSRATGVRLADGSTLEADAVLLAMGPWTSAAQEWAGAPIPVEPLKGQLIRLKPPDGRLPRVAVFHGGNYIAPKPGGHVLTGTTEERVGFDAQPTRGALDAIVGRALQFMPRLEAAAVVEHTACLRPLSTDRGPITGPVPGWERLFIATGHGRKGILQSVVTGRIMADLILRGRTKEIDLMPFLPDRFGV